MAAFFDNLLFIAFVLICIVFMLSVTLFIVELMEGSDDE